MSQIMNEAQAIKVLEDVTAQVNMNRESQLTVMNALNTLRMMVQNNQAAREANKPTLAPKPEAQAGNA